MTHAREFDALRLCAVTRLGAIKRSKENAVAMVLLAAIIAVVPNALSAREDGRRTMGAPSDSPVVDHGATGDKGKVLFERNCAVCHGIDGTGGRGPSLARPRLAHAPDDAALRAVIQNGIPPEMPDAGRFLLDDEVDELATYVRSLGKVTGLVSPGDVSRGKDVFTRSGCPSCHIVSGAGAGIGPELTDVGERRSPAYVRQAILRPAERLPADFLFLLAKPLSGDSVRGIRLNEDTFTVQIKDVAGKFYSLRKADLKELRQLKGETPMPAFEGNLTTAEIEDLVAFLLSPCSEP
jgi:cytochrome c oxidase cbb3-type subunit 3